jgi:hypothetical protein
MMFVYSMQYVQIYVDYQQHEQEIAKRNLGRPPKNNHQKLRANSEPRFFGISNYLGSYNEPA